MNVLTANETVLVGSFELEGAAPDMPIIGPLLMIWRDLAAKADEHARSADDMMDRLMDVVDNALAGATSVSQDTSGVARTIAYVDQARGLVEAPLMWRKFVDDLVTALGHRRNYRFIVRIDRVPHERMMEVHRATRRFAHPKIDYVIDGDV